MSHIMTYTGKKFDKQTWLKIPILITAGGDDYNDPLPYNDVYGEEDRMVTLKVFGEGSSQDRWEKSRQILAQSAPNVQTHTYPHVEHAWERQDVIDFLNAHKNGGPLKPITPTDTSSKPSRHQAVRQAEKHRYQYLNIRLYNQNSIRQHKLQP